MLPSDTRPSHPAELVDAVSRTEQLVRSALDCDGGAEVADEVVNDLVSAAARLYAVRAETTGQVTDPLREDVSTTEAIELACALLKSHDLNPFDLALWFSRTR